MAMTVVTNPGTVFDSLLVALQKAADYNRDDSMPPAAVLWPDEKREWEQLVPRIRLALPQFLIFGPYDAANNTGPAIWLRCALAGKIPALDLPPNTVPIIYLPGIGRSTLRATDECPAELKPLAELQYRGVFCSRANGKDWTVTAFLQTNHGGLQLRIARDNATATSIRRALDRLVDVSVADLQTKSAVGELNSAYFDALISDDPIEDLLAWLSDPKGSRDRWEANRWETLCSRCIADYAFDPARDGELVGAELLGNQKKPAWKTVWKRYAASPARYPGLIELLRRAKPEPQGKSLFDAEPAEPWPQDNEAAEAQLRNALLRVNQEPVATARATLVELEKQHRHRLAWVWAPLHRSPLARAILHLATLAEVTQSPLAGATTDDMVWAYVEKGWRADAALLDTLEAVSHPHDQQAVCAAIAHVYTPWLRDAAELFQQRVKHQSYPGRETARLAEVPGGTCVLFADGLRYDVGQKLLAALVGRVGEITVHHHFVALPSVTPTAKPAVSPVAGKIKGTTAGEEFRPSVVPDAREQGAIDHDAKELTIDRFRKLLDGDGFQVLGPNETGDPNGRAWAEFGSLDSTGHNEGIGLARRIPELLVTLTQRIEFLLAAGWREVRVVTDHGWLLLPGGLPKSELPKYLTQTRWGRCAVVKPNAQVDLPTFGWFWSDHVTVACPEGISSFLAGQEYNHGGLSLQECVVPQFSIRMGKGSAVAAKIDSVKWAGLRCKVKITGSFAGCKVDLRDKAADPATSLAEGRSVGDDGVVSVVVQDTARDGSATTLVLVDAVGSVLEKILVTVGG
jgi:hypothetical protein